MKRDRNELSTLLQELSPKLKIKYRVEGFKLFWIIRRRESKNIQRSLKCFENSNRDAEKNAKM